MTVRPRFTRIPKTYDLILAGVPTEAIPTYCALADHANNKNGLCWPRMDTLARRLRRSPRTIQRHLHLLKEKGLVEFVERRRDNRGRFGAYLYRVLHIISLKTRTTGHGGRMALYKGQRKQKTNTPLPPRRPLTEGYEWLFGQDTPPATQNDENRNAEERRTRGAERRKQGFEWLFE